MIPPRRTPSTDALLVLVLAAHTVLAAVPADQTTDLGTTPQRLVEAYQALQAGYLDEAARALQEVLTASPDDERALLAMSSVHERRGELVDALGLARRAATLEPQSPSAALAVAQLLARLGAAAEALEMLANLRRLDPEAVQGYLLSALLLRDLDRGDEAIEILQKALSRGLKAPHLHEELALLLLAESRPAEARQIAQKALAQHGERATLHLALGLALATDPTSLEEALSPLEKALELGAADPGRVHLEIGGLLIEAERADEAIGHLESAAALLPDSAEVYYRLAAAQRLIGDLAATRQSLTRFQELNRRREQQERLALEIGTALNEAQELATSNHLGEAMERLDSLLRDHPDETRAHTLRAKILYSLERPEEALAAVRQSRELDPGRVEPRFLEGMFLMGMNRPAQATAALNRALTLDPDLGPAHFLLGGAAAKLDRPLEAVAHFERALELGIDSPALRLGYAAALESLGRMEESERQIEAYQSLAQRPE